MADGTKLVYRDRIAYLETKKAIVKIAGRLFDIKFNITKLSKEGIILGMPQLKAAKPQFNQEKERIVWPKRNELIIKAAPNPLEGEYNVQTLNAI